MPAFQFVAIASAVLLSGIAAPAGAVVTLNALTSNALTFNALTFNALTFNALTFNALTFNALSPNALAATGSAVSDLNGVAVEGISLPPAIRR